MSIQVTFMSIDFDSFEEPVTRTFRKGEVTIGRKPGNDIHLDRPEISGYHAKLTARREGPNGEFQLYVTDLGSSNGTMLERDSLTPDVPTPIYPNQRLIVGSYLLKPRLAEGADEISLDVEPVSEAQREIHAEAAVRHEMEDRQIITPRLQVVPSPTESTRVQSVAKSVEPLRVNGVHEASTINTHIAAPKLMEVKSTGMNTLETRSEETGEEEKKFTFKLDGNNLLDLHFVAEQLLSLSGRIVHKGSALSGVRVHSAELGAAITDELGRFTFHDIKEGTSYRCELSKEGYTFDPQVLSGTLDVDTELHIAAVKLHTLSGIVLHRGVPLAGVLVDAGAFGSQITGVDGLFSFTNIREGMNYDLKISREKFIFEPSVFSGVVDKNTEITIPARQLFTIGGRIMHKGKPVQGVEIECLKIGKAISDLNGMYVFENVPEGEEYTIVAAKPGFVFTPSKVLGTDGMM